MSSVKLTKLFSYLRLPRPQMLNHTSYVPAVQYLHHGLVGLKSPFPCLTPILTAVRSYKTELTIEWVRPPKVPSTDPSKSGDLKGLPDIDLSKTPFAFQESDELKNASPVVKRLLSLEFAPYSKAVQVHKQELLGQVRRHQFDTGSLETRITCLTVRIRALQKHMVSFKKDMKSKTFLKELIEQRYKYLKFLRRRDYRCYEWLLEQLHLTFKANPDPMNQVTRKSSLLLLTDRHCQNLREKRLEAYKKELDASKVDFLKEKQQILEWIEEEERALNIRHEKHHMRVFAQDDDEEASVQTEEVSAGHRVTVEEVPYASPNPMGSVYFAEHFDNAEDVDARWTKSQAKKDGADEAIAKYDGKWAVESLLKDGLKGDLGLVLKSKAKHAAISAMLDRPFHFTNRPLIVQYDVTFQSGQECGGAYLKLISHESGMRLSQFHDKTPYTIMFGPDKCGNDQKLHFIFRHKNPKNGTITEKHAKKPSGRIDEVFKDNIPHLFTLMIRPDNTFDVSVDYKIVNSGNLLEDFSPPVNPPSEIDDPSDSKPEDWDEREKIPDPEASKPEDWDEEAPPQIPDPSASQPDGWLEDEPEMIPDPTAEKPEDWDDDMDGAWEAPLVNNPACEKAGAIGFELWSMSDNIFFDNIIITDEKAVAEQWAAESFDVKRHRADISSSWTERVRRWLKHKPNVVMSYLMYMSVPVTLYVWYLRNRVLEESVVNRLVRYTNENPWLYAVYVIVIGLPIVLIFTFCCGGGQEKEQDKAAKAKKSDETEADDEPLLEEKEEDAAEEEDEIDLEEAPADQDQAKSEEVEVAEKASPRRRRARKD
nr:EOG090X09BQ [Lepidurus arcticus]